MVRPCCQVNPASHKVCRMVLVLTRGSPSGAVRSARRSVASDQVAVPSRSRSGMVGEKAGQGFSRLSTSSQPTWSLPISKRVGRSKLSTPKPIFRSSPFNS